MSSGVITVGAHKYAAGLYWQPSQSAKNIAAAAKAAAKQPSYQAQFYCVRDATKARPIAQFGLGLKEAGHKTGMPVIAACLANQQPGSWAGAFRVPEGIWLVVIRDDLIDSDGDLLFTDEHEAQTRLELEIARGGIIKIYAPGDWGIDASDETPLPSLLSGRRDVLLRATDAEKKLLIFAAITLVVGGLLYGGFTIYSDYEQKRIAEEEALRKAELARERAAKGQAPVAQIEYKRDWEFAPMPMEWLKACEQAFYQVPQTQLGWNQSGIECKGAAVNVSWTRATGPGLIPEKTKPDSQMKTASASYPLIELKPRGAEPIAPTSLISRLIMLNDWKITLTELPDDVAPKTDPNAPPPPPPPFKKRKFVYTTPQSPWEEPHIFAAFPGLVLTSIKLNGIVWNIEGTIYEDRNELPNQP